MSVPTLPVDPGEHGWCDRIDCVRPAVNRFAIPGRFVSLCQQDIDAHRLARKSEHYGEWKRRNLPAID